MTGNVYRIDYNGRCSTLPHSHVVVIELQDDCWIVPAFGTDGFAVELDISAIAKSYPREFAFVELDNSKHIKFYDNTTGLQAKWVVARARKLSKRRLNQEELIGRMDNESVCLLIEAALGAADAGNETFSPHLVRKLRRCLDQLREADDD